MLVVLLGEFVEIGDVLYQYLLVFVNQLLCFVEYGLGLWVEGGFLDCFVYYVECVVGVGLQVMQVLQGIGQWFDVLEFYQ